MGTDVYTVRMAFFDGKAWNPSDIINLYKTELKTAGFFSTQLPAVSHPITKVQVKENDPFQGARSITINAPNLPEQTQTRDTRVPFEQDPAKLAQTGEALTTVFTWNLCIPSDPGSGRVADPSGFLRDLFRKTKPDIGAMKLSPKVNTWEQTPEKEPGYPDRPVKPGTDTATAGAGLGLGLWAAVLSAVGLYWAKKRGYIQ